MTVAHEYSEVRTTTDHAADSAALRRSRTAVDQTSGGRGEELEPSAEALSARPRAVVFQLAAALSRPWIGRFRIVGSGPSGYTTAASIGCQQLSSQLIPVKDSKPELQHD